VERFGHPGSRNGVHRKNGLIGRFPFPGASCIPTAALKNYQIPGMFLPGQPVHTGGVSPAMLSAARCARPLMCAPVTSGPELWRKRRPRFSLESPAGPGGEDTAEMAACPRGSKSLPWWSTSKTARC
jgi:hypothetical protein